MKYVVWNAKHIQDIKKSTSVMRILHLVIKAHKGLVLNTYLCLMPLHITDTA